MAAAVQDTDYWKRCGKEALDALNEGLSGVKVAPGHSTLVTIAGQTFHMSSDDSGRLQCVPVAAADVSKVLPKTTSRVVVDEEAFKSVLQNDEDVFAPGHLQSRKVVVTGDNSQLRALQRDVSGSYDSIEAKLSATGPGERSSQAAALEVLQARQDREKEAFSKERAEQEKLGFDKSTVPWGTDQDVISVLTKLQGWVVFSAASVMIGNMGQGNYCSANNALDVYTFHRRQTTITTFNAISLMWGAVGGLGMRWKAFASQDALLKADNSEEVLMTIEDAAVALRLAVSPVSLPPEWFCAWKVDPVSRVAMASGKNPFFEMPKAPWGKGAGGGDGSAVPSHVMAGASWVYDDAEPKRVRPPPKAREAPSSQASTGEAPTPIRPVSRAWLFPGRRVKLQGLEKNAEMNGAKGTLVEKVAEGGKWLVKLDGDMGERLVKEECLVTLTGQHSGQTCIIEER